MAPAEPEASTPRECRTGPTAKLLGGCTAQTVRNMIERGDITARQERRGSRFIWLVDRDSIEDYQRRVGAPMQTTSEAPLSRKVANLEERLMRLENQPRVTAPHPRLLNEVVEQVRQIAQQHQHALEALRDTLVRLQVGPDEGDAEGGE